MGRFGDVLRSRFGATPLQLLLTLGTLGLTTVTVWLPPVVRAVKASFERAQVVTTASACRSSEALAFAERSTSLPEDERDLFRARLLLRLQRFADAAALAEKWTNQGEPARRASAWLLLGLAQANGAGADTADHALDEATRLASPSRHAPSPLEQASLVEADDTLLWTFDDAADRARALQLIACVRAHKGHLTEAAAAVRTAWAHHWHDTDAVAHAPCLAPVRAAGLLDDVLAQAGPSDCSMW